MRLGCVRKDEKSSFCYLLPSRLTLLPRVRDSWLASLDSAVSSGAILQKVKDQLAAELSAAEELVRNSFMESQLERLRQGELEGMLPAECDVRLSGLVSKPELNGTLGRVVFFNAVKGRYAVQSLDTERGRVPVGGPRLLNPTNLVLSTSTAAHDDADVTR